MGLTMGLTLHYIDNGADNDNITLLTMGLGHYWQWDITDNGADNYITLQLPSLRYHSSQCGATVLSDNGTKRTMGNVPKISLTFWKFDNSTSGYCTLSLKYATKMGSHVLRPRSTAFLLSGLYWYAKCKAPSDEFVPNFMDAKNPGGRRWPLLGGLQWAGYSPFTNATTSTQL